MQKRKLYSKFETFHYVTLALEENKIFDKRNLKCLFCLRVWFLAHNAKLDMIQENEITFIQLIFLFLFSLVPSEWDGTTIVRRICSLQIKYFWKHCQSQTQSSDSTKQYFKLTVKVNHHNGWKQSNYKSKTGGYVWFPKRTLGPNSDPIYYNYPGNYPGTQILWALNDFAWAIGRPECKVCIWFYSSPSQFSFFPSSSSQGLVSSMLLEPLFILNGSKFPQNLPTNYKWT